MYICLQYFIDIIIVLLFRWPIIQKWKNNNTVPPKKVKIIKYNHRILCIFSSTSKKAIYMKEVLLNFSDNYMFIKYSEYLLYSKYLKIILNTILRILLKFMYMISIVPKLLYYFVKGTCYKRYVIYSNSQEKSVLKYSSYFYRSEKTVNFSQKVMKNSVNHVLVLKIKTFQMLKRV